MSGKKYEISPFGRNDEAFSQVRGGLEGGFAAL